MQLQSPQAATALKHQIEDLYKDQTHTKKPTAIFNPPHVNPFKTLPKDVPQRDKNRGDRSSSGNFGSQSGQGGNFNRFNNQRGNFNNRGGNTMGFQRGGFNGPAGNMGGFGGPGPMNNFGGGPMGAMNNFGGGNFNRGGMMGGGMRGGMNNRGRGGMGMNNMGGMNMPMGNNMMGMGGGMGMMGGNMGGMMGGGMGTSNLYDSFYGGACLRCITYMVLTSLFNCRRRARRLRQQSKSLQPGFLSAGPKWRRRELEPSRSQEAAPRIELPARRSPVYIEKAASSRSGISLRSDDLCCFCSLVRSGATSHRFSYRMSFKSQTKSGRTQAQIGASGVSKDTAFRGHRGNYFPSVNLNNLLQSLPHRNRWCCGAICTLYLFSDDLSSFLTLSLNTCHCYTIMHSRRELSCTPTLSTRT